MCPYRGALDVQCNKNWRTMQSFSEMFLYRFQCIYISDWYTDDQIELLYSRIDRTYVQNALINSLGSREVKLCNISADL